MPTAETPVALRVVVFTDLAPVVVAYAHLLAAHGHQLVAVVTSRKRNPAYVDVVAGAPATADVLVSDRPRHWAPMLAPLRPDLVVATTFPWRIPQDVLDLPPLGAINLHPSLLPKYRGTMTPNWTLLNGERRSGLTAHRMVADFDAGPILAQASIDVSDEDDLPSYMQRLFAHAPAVVTTALERVIAGDPGEPQDESQATYYGAIPDDLRVIDWTSPAKHIHNQIRAFSAFVHPPGAYATIDGEALRILRSQRLPASGTNALPGTILDRDDEGLTIQCGDGLLRILAMEPA